MNTDSDKGPGESGLYNRIAVLRAERGISRQELADAMEVNYQTIGFLERGDYSPSLKLALSLGEYFGLPVEAIFSKRPFKPLSQQVYGRIDLHISDEIKNGAIARARALKTGDPVFAGMPILR